MNSCQLIGRLTDDPSVRVDVKHNAVTFRLAVQRRSNRNEADFVDIVTFDDLGKVCGQYLAKGRQVAVVGRLRLNEWTTDTGERRSKLQVIADAVDFLDRPKADAPAEAPAA